MEQILHGSHDDSCHPSSTGGTAIERFDPGAERAVRGQSEDRGEVAEAHRADGAYYMGLLWLP